MWKFPNIGNITLSVFYFMLCIIREQIQCDSIWQNMLELKAQKLYFQFVHILQFGYFQCIKL